MSDSAFTAAGFPWRLYSGPAVFERYLKTALVRAKAKRAFVICSPSISRRTNTADRIARTLSNQYVGVFDAIENDATFISVCRAKDAAVSAGADLLIAVGGGSVIMAARAVAILMSEQGDPFEIMTQYPKGKPAYSPKLLAPKLPIFNVPVTPTSAMNRAGTAMKNPDLDQRMEYFDPKLRPHSLFFDEDALLATPPNSFRSTATTVFSGLVGTIARTDANPLAGGDDEQAFRLAYRAYPRLREEPQNVSLLTDLMVAAFLQNRAEDDAQQGLLRGRAGPFSGDYAVSTAIHIRYPHIGQGESSSAIQVPKIRLYENLEAQTARRVAIALEVWREGMDEQAAALAVAEKLETLYTRAGMPTRLAQLDIPKEDLPKIAAETVKVFNANPGSRSPESQIADALRLLEAAY